MIYLIAVVLIIAGVLSVFVGMVAATDGEGRGGRLLLLVPLGAVLFFGGVSLLIYRWLGLLT